MTNLFYQIKKERKRLLAEWLTKRRQIDEVMRKNELMSEENIKEINEIAEKIKLLEPWKI